MSSLGKLVLCLRKEWKLYLCSQCSPLQIWLMKDKLDQLLYERQQLKAFQSSIRIQNGRHALLHNGIRTTRLVTKNRARNSLRMEGSAVKADATASVPSRPTASRSFAIAGQVRGTRMRECCGCRRISVYFIFYVLMNFRYIRIRPCPT